MLLGTGIPGDLGESDIAVAKGEGTAFYGVFHSLPTILDAAIGLVVGEPAAAKLVAVALQAHLVQLAHPMQRTYYFFGSSGWRRDLATSREVIAELKRQANPWIADLELDIRLIFARFDLQKHSCQVVDEGFGRLARIDPKGRVEEAREGRLNYDPGDLLLLAPDEVQILPSLATLPVQEALIQLTNAVGSLNAPMIGLRLSNDIKSEEGVLGSALMGSELDQLSAVRRFLVHTCSPLIETETVWFGRLQLAVTEAFANIVKHAYRSKAGRPIELRAEMHRKGLIIELADQGESFDPVEASHLDLTGKQESGYGLFIISESVSEVSYLPRRTPQGWNRLRLFKRFEEEEEKMNVTQELRNGTLVLRLEGETLDASRSQVFKQQVIDAIEQHGVYNLVFDLGELKFIDSSGLGSFLSILRYVNSHDGDLKLAGMSDSVRTMFQIVRMHKLFEIYNTVDECCHSFAHHQS